jgi:hypothetical protein
LCFSGEICENIFAKQFICENYLAIKINIRKNRLLCIHAAFALFYCLLFNLNLNSLNLNLFESFYKRKKMENLFSAKPAAQPVSSPLSFLPPQPKPRGPAARFSTQSRAPACSASSLVLADRCYK